jgi:hypothetical protein
MELGQSTSIEGLVFGLFATEPFSLALTHFHFGGQASVLPSGRVMVSGNRLASS